MFSINETRIEDIQNMFMGSEDEIKHKTKDIAILASQYGKPGRRAYIKKVKDKNGSPEYGISYRRALDCFMLMILDKNGLDYYNKSIIHNNIHNSVAGYLENKTHKSGVKKVLFLSPYETQIKEWTLDKYQDIILCDDAEILFKIEFSDNTFKEKELGKNQKLFIKRIISQLCSPLIKRYLVKDNYSWCREERQIALFLYDILLSKKRGIVYNLGDNINGGLREIFNIDFTKVVIEDVYYEAAILRDYYHSFVDTCQVEELKKLDRQILEFCFNKPNSDDDDIKDLIDCFFGKENKPKSLIGAQNAIIDKYVGKNSIWKELKEKNKRYKDHATIREKENEIGKDDKKSITDLQRIYFACMIMNAKPDILVIYHEIQNEKKRNAILLECKNESDPGMYDDYLGYGTINQILLQEMIMTFMFGKSDKWKKEADQWGTKGLGEFLPSCSISPKIEPDKEKRQIRQRDRQNRWKEIYSFCYDCLTNEGNLGLFNENCYEEKYIIHNMGVVEVDFKEKKRNDRKQSDSMNDAMEDQEKGITNKTVVLNSEDLINAVYYGNM